MTALLALAVAIVALAVVALSAAALAAAVWWARRVRAEWEERLETVDNWLAVREIDGQLDREYGVTTAPEFVGDPTDPTDHLIPDTFDDFDPVAILETHGLDVEGTIDQFRDDDEVWEPTEMPDGTIVAKGEVLIQGEKMEGTWD